MLLKSEPKEAPEKENLGTEERENPASRQLGTKRVINGFD